MRQPVLSGTVSGPSRKRIFQPHQTAWDLRRLLEGLPDTGTQVRCEILSPGFLCCHHIPQSAEYGTWRAVFPGVSPLFYKCAGGLRVFKKSFDRALHHFVYPYCLNTSDDFRLSNVPWKLKSLPFRVLFNPRDRRWKPECITLASTHLGRITPYFCPVVAPDPRFIVTSFHLSCVVIRTVKQMEQG